MDCATWNSGNVNNQIGKASVLLPYLLAEQGLKVLIGALVSEVAHEDLHHLSNCYSETLQEDVGLGTMYSNLLTQAIAILIGALVSEVAYEDLHHFVDEARLFKLELDQEMLG